MDKSLETNLRSWRFFAHTPDNSREQKQLHLLSPSPQPTYNVLFRLSFNIVFSREGGIATAR